MRWNRLLRNTLDHLIGEKERKGEGKRSWDTKNYNDVLKRDLGKWGRGGLAILKMSFYCNNNLEKKKVNKKPLCFWA
jgi:hypothetical protein